MSGGESMKGLLSSYSHIEIVATRALCCLYARGQRLSTKHPRLHFSQSVRSNRASGDRNLSPWVVVYTANCRHSTSLKRAVGNPHHSGWRQFFILDPTAVLVTL